MNIKNYSKALVATLLLAGLSFSCDMQKSQFPGFSETEDGVIYKFHAHGTDTIKANERDMMSTYMSYRTMDDSVFNSSVEEQPFELPMMESSYEGDVFAALRLMSSGDSATFVINSDSFFQITAVGFPRPEVLDSGSFFYLDVKMLEIKTPEQLDRERMELERQQTEQERAVIANYIAANNLKAVEDASGIYIVANKQGKGKAAAVGSFAKVHLVAKFIGEYGSEFINTHNYGEAVDFEVGTGQLGVGFEAGLVQMKEGGKATIIAPFALAFGAQGIRGNIPPFATIVYDVELVEVISAETMQAQRAEQQAKMEKEAAAAAANEPIELKKYLTTNGITVAPTASGLYYVVKEEGAGKQAVAGKTVRVHYTGILLDGTKFDSSVDRGQPFEFPLGQGQVIRGWDEGIALMKEGGKATLIIPSDLGYGPRGAGQDIPPYSSLVFEVELIEVLD